MTTTSILFILSLLGVSSVRAENDWSVPCVAGGCSWDTGNGKTTAYSSMAIGGQNNVISDITPAAGWAMTGCDPNWKDGPQTVRLKCTGTAKQTAHCDHVFEGGAENTIVRLPENCGKGPFARVVSVKNQTRSVSARAGKSSTLGGTHTFTLDYNFTQIPTSRGKVTFAVTSTNVKGLPGVSKRDLDALRGRGRAGEIHRRNFGHLGASPRAINDTLSSATDGVDPASSVAPAAKSIASIFGNQNFSKNTGILPLKFEKNVVLFDQSISCNSGNATGGGVSGTAQLKVDVDGKVDATVSFGVTIIGTILPPGLSDFSVSGDLGGNASATFNVDAKAVGTFDTSPIPLFKFGFPGLSIPGIATLGPEFSINGQITAELQAEAKMAIQTAWDFPNVHLVFPPEKGSSTGAATASSAKNPLQLSVDPTLDVSASVGAHIIPRVDFGIDIFGGKVSASVFLDTDISATLTADVKAQAKIDNNSSNTSTGDKTATDTAISTDPATTDSPPTDTATSTDPAATDSQATDTATTTDPAATDNQATDTATSTDPAATDNQATDTATSTDPAATDSQAADTATTTDPAATDNQATDTATTTDPAATDSPATDTATSTDPAATDDPDTDTTDVGFFRERSLSELRQRAAPVSTNGCITLSGGIAVNGGLQGSLEPFIKQKEITFKIFSKDAQLFQKCLNGGAQRRDLEVIRRAGGNGLQCPANGIVSALKSLV